MTETTEINASSRIIDGIEYCDFELLVHVRYDIEDGIVHATAEEYGKIDADVLHPITGKIVFGKGLLLKLTSAEQDAAVEEVAQGIYEGNN